MRTLAPVMACLVSVGCASHKIDSNRPKDFAGIDESTSIYIAVPDDGRYEGHVYAGSGIATANVLTAEFAKQFHRAQTAARAEPTAQAIQSARGAGCDYIVLPTILSWEDRATEWSGKPDRIEIRIEFASVSGGQQIDSSVLSAKSAWATFGGDRPQDLLRAPIAEYVAKLRRSR